MKGRSRFKDVILPIAIIIAGFAALSPLSDLVAARKPVVPESYNDADLFVKGRELKGFVLGTESLVADWYWMRSLQYIGDKVVNSKEDLRLDDLRNLNPRLLYPLLDSATDLDPHFIAPYAYGAMVLPAIDGNQAIAIAEKGIASNPNEWRLYQQLGYIYWRLKMYDEAAKVYKAGSKIPGSAAFMKLMAASMKTEGGSRPTARAIYTQMISDAEDEQTRDTAKRLLDQINSMDDVDALNNALAEYKQTTGHCAGDLRELEPILLKTTLPGGRDFSVDAQGRIVDPSGTPYGLDRAACTATPPNSKPGSK